MADLAHEIDGDRVVILLDPGQPVELEALSSSFAALARIYERHYRAKGDAAPKLYVTRIESGSVILEIAPLAYMLGALAVMDGGMIAADFANRLWRGIKAFSGHPEQPPYLEAPPVEDAIDLKEFTRPLLGKPGARLGIKHARMEHETKASRTVVEYSLDEAELNRAAINIDNQLSAPVGEYVSLAEPLAPLTDVQPEVWMFMEQANRGPGKQSGRTGDRGVIPSISSKAVPVYFRKSIQGLKERMLLGQDNPFEMVFVVTVHVQSINGEVQGYTVLDIHDSFPRDES